MKSVTSKGKQSTRDLILHALKSSAQSNIESLADAADVSPITVRHHLNSLQAEGLIEVESVRRKVGRPYYVYSLTEKGNELFPQKYFSLTNRLLEELKDRLPPETVNEIFISLVERMMEERSGEFEGLSFEGRLNYVVNLLATEGFLARWEKTEDGRYQIIEYSCPYISMGQQHTEVCTLDKQLMINVLGTAVEQHSCMLQGDDCCQFTLPLRPSDIPVNS
ncbi:MAG: ArsR family transcriptional regulator [Anaerolineaceae bacterium]|nr:ArsR family transcriptional regulator [Anaerolineaceae bacterium]